MNIVQTAANRSFTTLVTAVNTANLSNTLSMASPLTVFAPTDAAFSQLPMVVREDLFKAENNVLLTKILRYHVVSGNVSSASITSSTPINVTTLQGSALAVSRNGSGVQVNSAMVVAADVLATNGVIHGIDKVLLPPFDIVETALTNGIFRTLISALRAADLLGALQATGPFTVFAPTDTAFEKIANATLVDLLRPANKDKLANILKYHVVSQRLAAANLPAMATTLAGQTVAIMRNGSMVKVNNATVTQADIATTNGLIHIIDTVLMPADSPSGVSKLFDSSIFLLIISTIVLRLF